MKTIAVRLNEEVFDLLTVVSQLEGTSIVDQIRDAISVHLDRKVKGGELAERAQSALADIDREANARKEAIGSLIGTLPKDAEAPTKGRSRRGQAPGPEADLADVRPIGFAPGRGQRKGGPAGT